MGNKEFDKNIKQILESIDSKTPPNDWELFSQLLNQEEGFEDLQSTDEDFDSVVSSKIKNHRKGFNSSHWVLLKNRLEKEAMLRKEIYTTKIMESILVLLLVFTFINLDNYFSFAPADKITPQLIAMSQMLNYPDMSGIEIIKNDSNRLKKEVNFNETKPINIVDKLSSDLKESKEGNQMLLRFIPVDIIKLDFLNSSNNPYNKVNQNKSKAVLFDQASNMDMTGREDIVELNILKSDNEVAMFDLKEAYPMFYIKPRFEEKRDVFFTAGISSVFGVISSPGDQTLDLDSYNIYNIDFATGVEISTMSNNIELGIGLNYQSFSYQPAKVTEITGGFQSPLVQNSLDKIQFDLFQVPLNFRYHFNTAKKTHLYAGVSLGLNLAGFTSYKITSEEIAPPSAPFGPEREEMYTRTILDDKNFHRGALENGSIFDNFYISAMAEVGLERQIDSNISINASVGYSKSLSYLGLGPNKDIIDAVKVGLGMKYRI